MIQRVFLLVLFVHVALSASALSLDFFKDKPKSLTKDFYISQFLDQNITSKDAKVLLPQVKNLNPKLKKKFARYLTDFQEEKVCQKLKKKAFLEHNTSCIKRALSLYKATQLAPSLLNKIAKKIESEAPSLAVQYYTIATKSFSQLIKLPPNLLLETFNNVGGKFRTSHYNHPLPKGLLTQLVEEKAFNSSVEKIVRGEFGQLQKSIVEVNATSLNAESNFLLALNAMRFGQLEKALHYLKTSEEKAPFTFEKDKALFWQYLLTQDKKILQTLTESYDINLYTLYAHEKRGTFPDNIIQNITPKGDKKAFDIKDPFAWLAFQERVKTMQFENFAAKKAWIMQYNTPEMEPHISRLLYRYKDNLHFFLTPYSAHLKDTPLERKIIIYALARQESYFVPTVVSYSYALGMMQFMPFVAKDIAHKEKLESFRYEDIFDPKVAYRFANIHLDFLEKSLEHPLFMAYAYNAGLGYTKRNVLSKNYFKAGAYEPFWSLEMIPNSQMRKYGKKVLANYTVYAKLLGEKTTLFNLLQTLK